MKEILLNGMPYVLPPISIALTMLWLKRVKSVQIQKEQLSSGFLSNDEFIEKKTAYHGVSFLIFAVVAVILYICFANMVKLYFRWAYHDLLFLAGPTLTVALPALLLGLPISSWVGDRLFRLRWGNQIFDAFLNNYNRSFGFNTLRANRLLFFFFVIPLLIIYMTTFLKDVSYVQGDKLVTRSLFTWSSKSYEISDLMGITHRRSVHQDGSGENVKLRWVFNFKNHEEWQPEISDESEVFVTQFLVLHPVSIHDEQFKELKK